MVELKYDLEIELDKHLRATRELMLKLGSKTLRKHIGDCYIQVALHQLENIEYVEVKDATNK